MSKVIRLSDDLLNKLEEIKKSIVDSETDPVLKNIYEDWEEKEIINYLITYHNISSGGV